MPLASLCQPPCLLGGGLDPVVDRRDESCLLHRHESRRRRPAGRHNLVPDLVRRPLFEQDRRSTYGPVYEPSRYIARDAFPDTRLYECVREERNVGWSRAVQCRRGVEETLRQLHNLAYMPEDLHHKREVYLASLVCGHHSRAEPYR